MRDDSIPYFLACPNLRDLNIFQTDLSTEGQARLLVGLKHLSHLQRGDFLADVVDYLNGSDDSEQQEPGSKDDFFLGIMGEEIKLKIQEFWASEEYYFHTEEQMELTAR